MANFLLKKSYQINNLKVTKFKDLWGSSGVFTTIRLVGKPGKLILYDNHLGNLIKSLKRYKIYSKSIESDIKKQIKDVEKFSLDSPLPDIKELFTEVYL